MVIYHIEFAKTGTGLSGGEKCMIENIKYLKKQKKKNILLTTDNGRLTYEKLGLKEDDFFKYKTINSYGYEKKHHIFLSYLRRTLQALKLIKKIKINDQDVLFCHSEFFPNSIPFYFLSRKNNKSKLFYWFHMLAPDIFKGYGGHFTNKFKTPSLALIHYKLNQNLYRRLTSENGTILTVNHFYKEYLGKKYPKNKIYVIKKYGGVNIPNFKEKDKKYDLIWMGRFHQQKGLYELIKIVTLLKKHKENIKVIVLGGENDHIEYKFKRTVKNLNLERNIFYKGFISGEKKFKYLIKSKIFLMTSFYESFGQVNLEAMKCGLPVVAYNLPVFSIFKKGMIKVPILNNEKFMQEVLRLLNNKKHYKNKSKEALEYASAFSWNKTGREIYNLMKKI